MGWTLELAWKSGTMKLTAEIRSWHSSEEGGFFHHCASEDTRDGSVFSLTVSVANVPNGYIR